MPFSSALTGVAKVNKIAADSSEENILLLLNIVNLLKAYLFKLSAVQRIKDRGGETKEKDGMLPYTAASIRFEDDPDPASFCQHQQLCG
jgi:hypothetical protein